MTDPVRWCDDDDVSERERALVMAGQQDRLPDAERRALWASIALSRPPVPASRGKVFGGRLLQGALLAAAVGGVCLAAIRLRPSAAPPSTTSASTAGAPARAPALVVSSAPVPELTGAEPGTTAAEPSPAVPLVPRPSPSSEPRRAAASQLLEESAALLEARSALRAGDAARALTLLERARSRFPHGSLGQEREALTIEALARSGQAAKARRRAEKFLRAYPQSPYATDVRRAAGS